MTISLISQILFAQTIMIHTGNGISQFNLSEIDSITFSTTGTPSDNFISGHALTQDEIWSGDIILKGDIVIPEGITLTIQPGTVIKAVKSNLDWEQGYEDETVDIYLKGKIIANGTAANPIVLTVDSDTPEAGDWGGIGCSSGSSVEMKYCCIAYAEYGFFVYSSSTQDLNLENCMFVYTNTGIVDFGGYSTLSHCTFINSMFGYDRWTEYRTTNISNCVFKNNSIFDVEALESYNKITIESSNFLENGWYNLYISDFSYPVNVTIDANNCYGISQTEDNGCGTITVTNPLTTPVENAGCGFEIDGLPGILTKSLPSQSLRKLNSSEIAEREKMIKAHNEKDKNYSR